MQLHQNSLTKQNSPSFASANTNPRRNPHDPLPTILTLLQQLSEQYAAAAGGADEQTLPRMDVSAIVERLLTDKRADGLSARYIETLRSHLRRFAAAFDRNIASIAVHEIETWLRSLGTGARARNNVRGSIITLFHFARKHGWLEKGQPTEADDIATAKDFGGRIGILTPGELRPVIGRASDKIQLFLALGAFAGLRSSEILRLEWQDISLERKIITVAPEKAKTATRRLTPILPNLEEWLGRHRAAHGALFRSRRDADRAIGFAKGCGLKWPNNALRHSYATYRLAATADVARVAVEMGNSPQKLIRHYRELADPEEAEAWFSIRPNFRRS